MRQTKNTEMPPEPYKVGYARVSTEDQNLDMQIAALKRAGVKEDDIYVEKISSRRDDRPELRLAISELREGDAFVVWKLDRIARSLRDLFDKIDRIKEAGASLVSITEKLDFSTPMGKLMMNMIGALAEFERDLISERTKSGMRAFKERGGKPGRAPSFDAKGKAQALKLLNSGALKKSEVAKALGVSPTTLNNYFEVDPKTAGRKKPRWRAKK